MLTFKLSEGSTMFNQALMYRKEGWRFLSLSGKRKYRRLQIGLGSGED